MNLKKSHIQFWIGIPILLIITLFFDNSFDLYVYVDHYNISPFKLAIGISVFLLLSGFGYYVNRNKEMNAKLTRSHKKMTLIGLGLCLLVFFTLFIKNYGLTEPPGDMEQSGMSLDQSLILPLRPFILIVIAEMLIGYIVEVLIFTSISFVWH